MRRLMILLYILMWNQVAKAQIASNGVYFDGVSTYVQLPVLPFFSSLWNNPFTIEAWVRCDAGNSNDEYVIFSNRDESQGFPAGNGFKLTIENGYLALSVPGGYSVAGGQNYSGRLDDGKCHHVALVKETTASGYKAYVDGNLLPWQFSISPSYLNSSIPSYLGMTNENIAQWSTYFTGVMKEVRVWSVGRTQSQIQANANVVVPYNSPNLVHYWRMNGAGSTITDFSTTVGGGTGTVMGGYSYVNSCTGCFLPPSNITISSTATVCLPATITLSAPTGPGYTYQWKQPFAFPVIIPGATGSTYIPTTENWYHVVITNSCGSVTSNNLVAHPAAIASATIQPFTNPACSTVTLYAGNPGNGSGYTYAWKKNGVAISGATSNTLPVTTSGSYTVSVTNVCGTAVSNPAAVTIITSSPGTPGSIATSGGGTKVCPGESRTYSISNVANASSYTWTAPAGSVIMAGQGTTSVVVSYNSGFTLTDTLRVKANNSCGSGGTRKLTIVRNNPAKPSLITGATYGVCNASAIPYSVTNVTGMTYNWTYSVPNTLVFSGQGTSSITANYSSGFLSGVLNVTASNACGVSLARTLTVYAKPATPTSIIGPAQVCVNQQNVPYSIAPLFGANTYTWTSPTGATVSNGIVTGNSITSTATSVQVDFATVAGNVRVRGNNSCASGSYRSLAVTFNCREAFSEPAEEQAEIFPNPFDDELNFKSAGFDEVSIFDCLGKLVFFAELEGDFEQINPALPDGIYMLRLSSETNSETFRIVRAARR